MSVCENRVLRDILGSESVGLVGDWRKRHREELHDLYSLRGIILLMSGRLGLMGNIV